MGLRTTGPGSARTSRRPTAVSSRSGLMIRCSVWAWFTPAAMRPVTWSVTPSSASVAPLVTKVSATVVSPTAAADLQDDLVAGLDVGRHLERGPVAPAHAAGVVDLQGRVRVHDRSGGGADDLAVPLHLDQGGLARVADVAPRGPGSRGPGTPRCCPGTPAPRRTPGGPPVPLAVRSPAVSSDTAVERRDGRRTSPAVTARTGVTVVRGGLLPSPLRRRPEVRAMEVPLGRAGRRPGRLRQDGGPGRVVLGGPCAGDLVRTLGRAEAERAGQRLDGPS